MHAAREIAHSEIPDKAFGQTHASVHVSLSVSK